MTCATAQEAVGSGRVRHACTCALAEVYRSCFAPAPQTIGDGECGPATGLSGCARPGCQQDAPPHTHWQQSSGQARAITQTLACPFPGLTHALRSVYGGSGVSASGATR
jgi:hypothetical protein